MNYRALATTALLGASIIALPAQAQTPIQVNLELPGGLQTLALEDLYEGEHQLFYSGRHELELLRRGDTILVGVDGGVIAQLSSQTLSLLGDINSNLRRHLPFLQDPSLSGDPSQSKLEVVIRIRPSDVEPFDRQTPDGVALDSVRDKLVIIIQRIDVRPFEQNPKFAELEILIDPRDHIPFDRTIVELTEVEVVIRPIDVRPFERQEIQSNATPLSIELQVPSFDELSTNDNLILIPIDVRRFELQPVAGDE